MHKKQGVLFTILLIFFLIAGSRIGTFINASETKSQKGQYRNSSFIDKRPTRECRRVNARFGYYANPWCTPKEQTIWDHWDAKRFKKK